MKSILFFFTFWFCTLLFAQENRTFSPINTSNGLSDNRVRAIAQLNDGRIVIATEGLINIYNGTEFSYLHTIDTKAYTVSNYTGFHRLYIDNENRLWLKNQSKLTCFDLYQEAFVANIDSLFRNYGIRNTVNDFFVDSYRNFWYLTNKNELFYRKSGERKAMLLLSKIPTLEMESDQLADIESRNALFFLFFKSGKLDCYNIKNKKPLYTENPFSKTENLYTRTLQVIPYKQYLYQLRNGVFGGGSLIRFDFIRRKWDNVIKTNWQNGFTIDQNGNSWLSSKQGLIQIDSKRNGTKQTSNLRLVNGKQVKVELSTQFIDKEGGLWLGTENSGLLYYHADQFKFKRIDASSFKTSNTITPAVYDLIDLNGDILIGTDKGLFLFNEKTRNIKPFSGIPADVFCNQLTRDSKNRIWLCTRKHGLFCIYKGIIKQFKFPLVCQFLYESNNRQLYLTTTEGFGHFNPQTGQYTQIKASSRLGHIFQLIQFEKNKLLGVLYGDDGLFVYDTKKETIEYPNERNYSFLLHNNKKYHDIFIDHRKLIWFGTQDGLNVYDPLNKRAKCFFKEDGLINNNIRSITEDKQGNVWVSTSYGISCIHVSNNFTFSFSNFNHLDGVIGSEFLPRSMLNTKDNQLFWGGIDGFNSIDLDDFRKTNRTLSTPMFTRFLISGKEIKSGTKYDGNLILASTINNTKSLQLKYNQNFLSFDLSALNYINPTQTYYRYKLEGIDRSWIEIRPSNGVGQINYTNLPPGEYNLKVKATNNIQNWSNQYTELKIILKPPFWKTTFAYVLYFLLFVSALTFLGVSFFKTSKKRLIKSQEEALDRLKMSFFTDISHELKTPLSLIITPLDSIIKKYHEEPLKSKLTSIQRNANDLLTLVNQLLDFRKLEMNGEKLHLDYCNIEEFIQSIVDAFYEYAQEKEIELSLERKDSDIFALIDSDKLRKIMTNLLSNALKNTDRNGTIRIITGRKTSTNDAENFFTITITDNGCGIPENELPHLFDRFFQGNLNNPSTSGSGIGLHLVKRYVEMHNGTIDVHSRLNDGTTFTIEIPDRLDTLQKKEHSNNGTFNYTILIVEDNIEFCNFLSQELSEFYTIITASDGIEGLEKAKTERPNLIITDVMMPRMSGTELCYQIKNDVHISHIPVVMLTAKSSPEDQYEGFSVRADAYITKPFKLDLLLLRIVNLIEQQNQRKALFKEEIEIKPNSITTTKIDEEFFSLLMKQIDMHIDDIYYSVEQLSKDMNMDRTNLYRKLTAISGLSPIEFIRSVRLKKAAILLEQGHSISDVSAMVGFGTVSYFSKCFKNEFNIKPSQYKGRVQN